MMKLAHICIQQVSVFLQLMQPLGGLIPHFGFFPGKMQRLSQLVHNIFLAGFIAVKREYVIAELCFCQPFVNNLKRGHFLRYKQDFLSCSQALGDNIRNRLTFPSAGRSLQNKAVALSCAEYRILLAGIRINDLKTLLRKQAPVMIKSFDVADAFILEHAVVSTQGQDNRIVPDLV
ncbi:MAG TPA: hypothetical protein PLA31_10600, partial [Clostridia bacterium]|nr:hypothetical protein [Clostridia bacterium]